MLYSQLCAKGRHCSVWGRWGAFKTTHYLVQNVVAKLFNGTDAASVCCLLGHARLCCFIKMKKLGFFSPSWTNARAAGRAISLCYKNECKHNHVFLGGIVLGICGVFPLCGSWSCHAEPAVTFVQHSPVAVTFLPVREQARGFMSVRSQDTSRA